MLYYLKIKSSIPTDPTESRWYPRIAKYKSLFSVDMSRREIAQRTDSFIQPDLKPNHYWIEEKIINTFAKALNNFIKSNQEEAILICQPYLSIVAKEIGIRADIYSANLLLSKLKIVIQLLKIDQSDIQNEAGAGKPEYTDAINVKDAR